MTAAAERIPCCEKCGMQLGASEIWYCAPCRLVEVADHQERLRETARAEHGERVCGCRRGSTWRTRRGIDRMCEYHAELAVMHHMDERRGAFDV